MTQRSIKNLVLVGFMGTGKSSVGRLAATLLGFRFVDTDALIETQQKRKISEIFNKDGESAFREMERKLVEELSMTRHTVISTGGGTAINPANIYNLKKQGLVICLWASPEAIYRRVKNSTHRPLLREADPLGKIRTLLAQREPFYRQADVLIRTETRNLREVTQHVIHEFRLAVSSPPRPLPDPAP